MVHQTCSQKSDRSDSHPTNETAIEKTSERTSSQCTWKRNHTYWKKHNKAFAGTPPVRRGLQGQPGADAAVSDDQMADFYRDFTGSEPAQAPPEFTCSGMAATCCCWGLAGAAAPLRLFRTPQTAALTELTDCFSDRGAAVVLQ